MKSTRKPIPVDPARLPIIARRAERAIRTLATGPAIGCNHLVADVPAIICAAHPGGGLRCPACADEHTARHTDAVERSCDACGELVDRIVGFIAGASTLAEVVTPGGRHFAYIGPVTVATLGICATCADVRELDLFEEVAK